MMSKGSDMQNAATSTALFSSGYCSAGGFLVTKENLWQAAVSFAARTLIKKTWQNDRDQLQAPAKALTDEFTTDCLVWMLFHINNLSAGADGLKWSGKKWSLINHFIPYTEDEVRSGGRFESDFMQTYLSSRKISKKAKAVLDAGRPIWETYFQDVDPRATREQYFLNRSDVGWYQIRNALKLRGTVPLATITALGEAYKELGAKLRPQIFSTGMLLL